MRLAFVRTIEEYAPSTRAAFLMLAFTVFLWAIGVIFARGMRVDLPGIGLTFWRWSIAALIMLPFVWRDLIDRWPLIRPRIGLFLLLAFLQIFGSVMLFTGVNFTTAISGTLVNSSQPAMTALIALLILRHRLSWVQSIGLAAALFGVLISVSKADLTVLTAFEFNIGDIMVVAGTVAYAVYQVMLHRLPRGFSLLTLLFIIAATGSVMLVPFYIWETIYVRPVVFTPTNALVILFMALIISIVSIFLWNAGNRAVGPNRSAIFVNLFPIYGAALAIPFLGETLEFFHVIAVALVISGILMVIRGHKRVGE